MNYLILYVKALKELLKYNSDYKELKVDFECVHSTLQSFINNKDCDYYLSIKEYLSMIALIYMRQTPLENLVNKCHAISHCFADDFRRSEFGESFSLNVTVGNVYYRNKNIYNLTRSKLESIINRGPELDSALDAHVWLTFEDMTVFDLTIIPTLVSRGILPESELKDNPVLVWHESEQSEFTFEPLLVDNEFVHRVDYLHTL